MSKSTSNNCLFILKNVNIVITSLYTYLHTFKLLRKFVYSKHDLQHNTAGIDKKTM